ncbi:MAG: endonuclease/exonuclease/phosphatase family protein, partial [Clostridia bacterium]|nr:endonuclease/exonuclease/phosphatase family protein [Clostridia bacterium]
MKTDQKRFGVLLAALLSVAVLCVLLCAGCGKTEPQTTNLPEATEPAIADGAANPVAAADGATVSFDPAGLSFTGTVEKGYFDALTAAYGEDHVKVGFLCAPTDSLVGNNVTPSNEKAVKLEAGSYQAGADAYRFTCTLTGIQEKDYDKKYSAVAYVEVYGKILRCSTYSAQRNTISLTLAADAAYADLKDAEAGAYRHAVTVGDATKYSPYTAEQREQLFTYRFPNAFTVMSYNVEAYDLEDQWEGRNPDKALDIILEESPDIVGLQEINEEWNPKIVTLARAGGYTRLVGEYSEDRFEKNEILFKASKFVKIDEGTKIYKQLGAEMNIPNTENVDMAVDNHGRAFHYAVLEQKATGKKILFVNTHLHYGGTGGGHEEDDKMRRYQIRVLMAWMAEQAATYPDQIVTGDMNSNYTSVQGGLNMKVFEDGGFAMTLKSAEKKLDVEGTLTAMSRFGRETRYVFDYVLTKGDFGIA